MHSRTLLVIALFATPSLTAQSLPVQGPISLTQAVELGRDRGVQGALARSSARIADARIGQRRADLLPSLSAGATYRRQTLNLDEFGIAGAAGVTEAFDLVNLQLRASQSILDPAAWARLRAARDSVVAAGDDARNAGAISAAAAGVAWLCFFAARETVRARQADSAVAGAILEQSRRLVDAGVSAGIEFTRSGVSFGAIRSQLAVARNARDRARLDLARAIDLPSGAPLEIDDQAGMDPLPIAEQPDSAVAFALAHRADLAAERERQHVLGLGQRAIRAERLPTVAASGNWQQSGRKTSSLESSWQIQFGVNIPILDGFRRQARSAEQAARLEAQDIRLHDLTRQVEADTREALLDLASAREQVEIATDRERLAHQELSQAQDRFAAGVAGSLETSNAQLSLTAATDAVIQARVAYGVARVTALRVLGLLTDNR